MFLQSPLSGRKKSASTFLPPEKKEHLEDFTAEEVVRARKGKKKDPRVVGEVKRKRDYLIIIWSDNSRTRRLLVSNIRNVVLRV